MEHSLYPVPPRFTARRLVNDGPLRAICTLYGACGRDAARGNYAKRLAALFGEGEWWGGFLGGVRVVSAAPVYPPVPPRPRLPLCAARWHPRAFRPVFCRRPPPRPRAGPLPGAFFPAGRTPLAAPCASPKGSPPQSPSKRAACCWTAFSRRALRCSSMRPLAGAAPDTC